MKKLQSALLAALLTGLAAVPSARANVIITSPDTANANTNPLPAPFTIGYAFTVGSNNLTVTSLGIWDRNSDGLAQSHDVGLWTTGGSLLGSVTVPSGNATTLIGQFRYNTLSSSVTLTANTTYKIGAFYAAGGGDAYIEAVNNSTYDTNFSSVGPGWYIQASSLQFPDAPGSGIGYIGPNAQFTAVPEPSTWAMLLFVGGLTSMVVLRRRRIA